MKKLLIIFISVMAFAVQALAADVTVQGKVESNENADLKNVKIEVKGVDKIFTINNDGTYSLQVPEGKHVIKFSATGHGTKTAVIEINSNTTLDIELEKIRKGKNSRA